MSSSPKICLNMIVKNESKIIERCLNSVLSIIDYIVITDTGSTDNTIQLIETFIQEKNLKGKVYQEPWKNFGYNRTNSIQNAKDYLQSIQEDLSTVLLFFIDADMKIMIQQNFQKSSLSNLQVGQIIQKNNSIQYYNTRMCRADIGITCRGVTHEYYDIPQGFHNTKVDTIYIDDIGDGGAKADKYTRDIKLLEQGIVDEPRNERYHFYLAQSYHCTQQYEKAIEYYKKRIELGGWHEEIYHSHYCIGNMYKDNIKDWNQALKHYLLSFQASKGKRGEPLVKVIEYYKDIREHHTSMIFLEKLLKLKYPKDDVLFIDYHVYSYKAIYELSILAYYLNLKYEGLLSTQYLILDKNPDLGNHIRDCAKRNLVFYISKLKTSSTERLDNVLLHQYYNPSSSSFSLLNPNENLYQGILRTVNYRINEKGHYLYPPHQNYIHTENYWVELQNNVITKQHHIKIAKDCYKEYEHSYPSIRGLEDGRHCIFNNEIYMSFTSFEYGRDTKASMVLTHMNKNTYEIDRIVSLKYEQDRIQKNWVPFVYQNRLVFVYSYQPFILLAVNPETGDCEEILKKHFPHELSDLRGSAPPIYLEHLNQYLIMTHEVLFTETRKYIHRFLLFDHEFNLLKLSEPFYLHELFIEFSLSIMYNPINNNIIIPFSYKDGESFITNISFDQIPWLPSDIKKYFEFFQS